MSTFGGTVTVAVVRGVSVASEMAGSPSKSGIGTCSGLSRDESVAPAA